MGEHLHGQLSAVTLDFFFLISPSLLQGVGGSCVNSQPLLTKSGGRQLEPEGTRGVSLGMWVISYTPCTWGSLETGTNSICAACSLCTSFSFVPLPSV